jgi:outer membrane protein
MNKNMKRVFRGTLLILAVIGLLSFGSASAAELRLATVDLRKIFDGYWKTKQADNLLQSRRNDLGEEFKALLKQGDKIKNEYDKAVEDANDPAASAEERDRRKKAALAKKDELDKMKQSAEQFDASAKAALSEQFRRMRDNVLGEIRDKIRELAKSGAYDLVVDVSAESKNNDTAIFVFVSGKNDLTVTVLTELNKDAPPAILKQLPPLEPEKKEK